jgi:hypothetical protein
MKLTGALIDRKQKRRSQVATEENLEESGMNLVSALHKKMGLSKETVKRHYCKSTSVHHLQPGNQKFL